MKLFNGKNIRMLAPLILGGALVATIACGGETEVVRETVVVTQAPEVRTEVQTVVVEKEVAGEKVVETVVVEKEKVVEKEVVQTVEVEKVVKETVEVEKEVEKEVVVTQEVEVEKEVVVTATPSPIPTAPGIEPVSPPSPQSGPDTVTLAQNEVGALGGMPESQQGNQNFKTNGMGETLFRLNPNSEVEPWLATEWEVAPDLSSATVSITTEPRFLFLEADGTIRDFGNTRAEDVVWTMNNANARTNPESIHGQAGDFAGLWDEWKVVDEDTFTFDFVNFDSTWTSDFANESGQAFSVVSKRALDEMGEEWFSENAVASGPYLLEDEEVNNFRTVVSRESFGSEYEHWKFKDVGFDRVRRVEIPDPTTRAATLKTGEIDVAAIEPKDVPQFSQGGWNITEGASAIQLGMFFAGNLWEKVHAIDGTPLTRGTYVHDLPWIGNPDDEEDMQEARSVRHALARAYDREAINEALLKGLGKRVDVMYFSTFHPRFDEKYRYDFDPFMAEEIISGNSSDFPNPASYKQGDAAGSPALGGNAFEVSLYAGPEFGGGTSVTGEVVDAVAGFWADLGLVTFTLKFDYSTFRPTVVGRTNTNPWITSCDIGRELNPWDAPRGLVETSLTRGGFSCGLESPEILNFYQSVATESDLQKRLDLNDQYLDYVWNWALQPGVVTVPNLIVMNPNKVKSWDTGTLVRQSSARPWNILPAD